MKTQEDKQNIRQLVSKVMVVSDQFRPVRFCNAPFFIYK